MPSGFIRGGGRPLGNYAMERAMDRLARELKLEPAELRRRNLLSDDGTRSTARGQHSPRAHPLTSQRRIRRSNVRAVLTSAQRHRVARTALASRGTGPLS